MKDIDLAIEMIDRLNDLLDDPGMQETLSSLIETRVPVSEEVADHPTVQVGTTPEGVLEVGLLGLLNGIVGVIGEGERKGWGYITAIFGDDGQLLRFALTATETGEVE